MVAHEDVTDWLRSAAEALERAATHCRIAAEHVENGRGTPRMAARALAARGDVLRGSALLDEVSTMHASRART